jgi:hypothetical protein
MIARTLCDASFEYRMPKDEADSKLGDPARESVESDLTQFRYIYMFDISKPSRTIDGVFDMTILQRQV